MFVLRTVILFVCLEKLSANVPFFNFSGCHWNII